MSERTQECEGMVGWLIGHRFEATESYRERRTPLPVTSGPYHETKYEGPLPPPDEYETTYHGHVGTRCGLVVNRPPTAQ